MVAGAGPEEEKLKAMAGDNVVFKGRVADEEIPDLYANAKAFVFPGEEDFGITPFEAQASGTPVIALGRGGALETVRALGQVRSPETGLFFEADSVASLKEAVRRFEAEKIADRISQESLQAWARESDVPVFEQRLKDALIAACPQDLARRLSEFS